jgi:hypothetical protein
MTTLSNKLQEITKRLQQLTVWRPNERDPFYELDHWRTDAHTTIEQIYQRKRQQIEQVMEKHEREFMRQIARQRLLLKSIRQRIVPQKELNSYNRTLNETSILTDLQKIENEINTKLGRGEIIIETNPLNFDDSVMIGLKTYLSATPSMYFKKMSASTQPKKPIHRSTDEVTRAFDTWLQVKKKEQVMTTQQELQSIRQYEQYIQEHRSSRQRQNRDAFDSWLNSKKKTGAFSKKQISIIDNNDITQETNAT